MRNQQFSFQLTYKISVILPKFRDPTKTFRQFFEPPRSVLITAERQGTTAPSYPEELGHNVRDVREFLGQRCLSIPHDQPEHRLQTYSFFEFLCGEGVACSSW